MDDRIVFSEDGSISIVIGRVVLEGGQVLVNTHKPSQCHGRTCSIHNRTDHHMRGFSQNFRPDRGIIERICPHGIGHPDPDDRPFWESQGRLEEFCIHGCDLCCLEP